MNIHSIPRKATDNASLGSNRSCSASGTLSTKASNSSELGMNHRRSFTIPLLVLVFTMSFLMAFLVLLIPLLIAFAGTSTSNSISTSTASLMCNQLGNIIQEQTSESISSQIRNIFSNSEEYLLQYSRMVSSGATTPDNFDTLYRLLFLTQKQLGPIQMLYYAEDATQNFYGLQSEVQPEFNNRTIIYLGYSLGNSSRPPQSCNLCPTISASNQAFYYNVSLNDGSINYEDVINSYPYIPSLQPWYQSVRNQTPSTAEITYTAPYVFKGGNKYGITASYPFFTNTGALHGVMGVDISLESLSESLSRMIPTPNAFMYVMAPDGSIVGSSSNDTLFKQGNLIKVTDMKNPLIALSGKYLFSLVSGDSDLSRLGNYGAHQLDEGGVFFEHNLFLNHRGLQLISVTGAPKSDYVGNIDQVQVTLAAQLRQNMLKVILISFAVFAVLTAISIYVMYVYVGRPLNELGRIMNEASQFDFSSLKYLMERSASENSLIREFESMQFSFLTMFKKFADAIKNSRSLWQNYYAESLGGTPVAESPVSYHHVASPTTQIHQFPPRVAINSSVTDQLATSPQQRWPSQ